MSQYDVLVSRGMTVSVQTIVWVNTWEDNPSRGTHTSPGRAGRRGSWGPV